MCEGATLFFTRPADFCLTLLRPRFATFDTILGFRYVSPPFFFSFFLFFLLLPLHMIATTSTPHCVESHCYQFHHLVTSSSSHPTGHCFLSLFFCLCFLFVRTVRSFLVVIPQDIKMSATKRNLFFAFFCALALVKEVSATTPKPTVKPQTARPSFSPSFPPTQVGLHFSAAVTIL